jgi:tRNA(Arg) A34 adenosine deaminase TadA
MKQLSKVGDSVIGLQTSGRLAKFLRLAIKECVSHEFEDLLQCNLAAVIVRGGSVLSVGFNNTSRNSFVQYLSDFDLSGKPFINTHAEVDAILKIRNKIDLTGCKMYVARYKPGQKELGMARPCATCSIVLKRYGIRRAYYTIDENHYGIMTVNSATDKIVRV